MNLPYGIEEQYIFFKEFFKNPSSCKLHIQAPYYETASILAIALHDWEIETQEGVIQYIESDTCSKRILTNRSTNQVKTIQLDIPYESGWKWNSFPNMATSVRLRQSFH